MERWLDDLPEWSDALGLQAALLAGRADLVFASS